MGHMRIAREALEQAIDRGLREGPSSIPPKDIYEGKAGKGKKEKELLECALNSSLEEDQRLKAMIELTGLTRGFFKDLVSYWMNEYDKERIEWYVYKSLCEVFWKMMRPRPWRYLKLLLKLFGLTYSTSPGQFRLFFMMQLYINWPSPLPLTWRRELLKDLLKEPKLKRVWMERQESLGNEYVKLIEIWHCNHEAEKNFTDEQKKLMSEIEKGESKGKFRSKVFNEITSQRVLFTPRDIDYIRLPLEYVALEVLANQDENLKQQLDLARREALADDRLPLEYKLVLVLDEMGEMDHEIAAILGTTPGNVASWKSRGEKLLRFLTLNLPWEVKQHIRETLHNYGPLTTSQLRRILRHIPARVIAGTIEAMIKEEKVQNLNGKIHLSDNEVNIDGD
jgi:hypothetical protein